MKKFEIIPQTDNSELTFEMIGEMELLPFLLEALQSKGRNSVKSILSRGQVSINNIRSEEHTSELQSRGHLVCRLLLEKIHNSPRSTLCPYTTLFRSRK